MSLLKLLATLVVASGLVFSANSMAAATTQTTVPAKTVQAKPAVAVVNINTADVKTLKTLKGMSDKKAQAIVDYRTKNGLFASVDDLTKVKGFGAKSVAKLKQQNPDLLVANK
jgi:competence protein ComEA